MMSEYTDVDISSLKEKAKDLSVLYVEDDIGLRDNTANFLGKFFKRLDVAADGKEAWDKYLQNSYDIVITDILMPHMDGLELIAQIRKTNKKQEIIITSAFTELSYLTKSIQLGVTGYIVKPISFNNILSTIKQSIDKLQAFAENEMYKTKLEEMVEERTQKIVALQQEQIFNFANVISSLAKMIDKRDTYTGGHSERVATYSRDIAKAMGLDKTQCDLIYQAGILHDIGKIIIPDSILLKPGKLTQNEYKLIQEHVIAGYEILSEIPMYKELADIILAHHEHYDGSGYPYALKDEEIPPLARIMTIADTFDAMTTSRIYKGRKDIAEALQELKSLSGLWYDPGIIDIAIDTLREVDIDSLINQDPHSSMDDERFSYFYKDSLTHVYNYNYLDFILQKNKFDVIFRCVNIIYVKKFSFYNKKYGWSRGDAFLTDFASYLRTEFPDAQIFRIMGDDFLLLKETHQEIDIDKINASPLLKDNHITCEYKHIALKESHPDSYQTLQDMIKA